MELFFIYFCVTNNKSNSKYKKCTFMILFKLLKCPHRERGDIELFITLVPNVFDNVFLFVGLTTLGTFIEF